MAIARTAVGVFRLDFSKPPDFALTMQRKGHVEAAIMGATKPGGSEQVTFRFLGMRVLDEDGNKALLYEYKCVAEGSVSEMKIWTRMVSVAPQNLEEMRIDRVPYCIVQAINEAGNFPIPLNNEAAPEAERFQYKKR